MSSSLEARALSLAALAYRAGVEPERWTEFLVQLASELGEPAIAMTLELPRSPQSMLTFRVHSDPSFGPVFADYATRGALPFTMGSDTGERFVDAREAEGVRDFADTDFYRDFMEPQGMHREGPVGLILGSYEGRPMACLGIYRRVGGRRLEEDDRALLDLLVSHLRQAYVIHRELRGHRQRRDAVAEVMDRYPTGTALLDRRGKVIATNRAAKRLLAHSDGLLIEEGLLRATHPNCRVQFERMIREAVAGERRSGVAGDSAFEIERPSGKRPYGALATSLDTAPDGGVSLDAVAVLFVADSEDRPDGMPELLRSLYHLTEAESELAALLCSGESIESAAAIRGVMPNTARAQLKQVFAKTGARRQSELVRLALTSVTALGEGDSSSESSPDPDGEGDARGSER